MRSNMRCHGQTSTASSVLSATSVPAGSGHPQPSVLAAKRAARPRIHNTVHSSGVRTSPGRNSCVSCLAARTNSCCRPCCARSLGGPKCGARFNTGFTALIHSKRVVRCVFAEMVNAGVRAGGVGMRCGEPRRSYLGFTNWQLRRMRQRASADGHPHPHLACESSWQLCCCAFSFHPNGLAPPAVVVLKAQRHWAAPDCLLLQQSHQWIVCVSRYCQ